MIHRVRNIDRDWIVSRIPHQGSMCLLDGVDSWDEDSVICVASGHMSSENPLRAAGVLGIANAVEYAAQAMAVHCALLIEEKKAIGASDEIEAPKSGYLTSVRQVNWRRSRFDDVKDELRVSVRRMSGNDITVLYGFEIRAGGELLIDGRASVVLNAAAI